MQAGIAEDGPEDAAGIAVEFDEVAPRPVDGRAQILSVKERLVNPMATWPAGTSRVGQFCSTARPALPLK